MVIKLGLIRDLEKSLQVTHYILQSPTLTIGETVLQQSADLDISGVAFDSKMTLRSILARFLSSSQILGILRKSWRVFHAISLRERCSRGFVLLVLDC